MRPGKPVPGIYCVALRSGTARCVRAGRGLHISFHYVRLMGGQLQVQSTPAATTFWFNIEAAPLLTVCPAPPPGTPQDG